MPEVRVDPLSGHRTLVADDAGAHVEQEVGAGGLDAERLSNGKQRRGFALDERDTALDVVVEFSLGLSVDRRVRP